MRIKDFKQKLELLRTLAASDVRIFDKAGIRVRPRSRNEIDFYPGLLEEVRQLMALESKRLGRLTREYAHLKFSIRFITQEGVLKRWTDDLMDNLASGEWVLITEEDQEKEVNHG